MAHLQRRMCFEGVLYLQGGSVLRARGKEQRGRVVGVAHLQRWMRFEGVLHLQGRSLQGARGKGRMKIEKALIGEFLFRKATH